MIRGLSFLGAICGIIFNLGQALAGSAIWLSTPSSGDWNAAANWTPGGPPNGAADSATFEFSTVNAISLSANTQVSSIEFSPGASAYTITSSPSFALSISGVGIINNSGQIQHFITAVDVGETIGILTFANSATAGALTSLTNRGGTSTAGFGGTTHFLDDSNAGHAAITNEGGTVFAAQSGFTQFLDNSSAADSTVLNTGGGADGAFGGVTLFLGTSSAGQAHFTNEAGLVSGAGVGLTQFFGTSTADSGTFTNHGATGEGEPGGATVFTDNSTAANGSFSNRGGRDVLGHGGATLFFGNSTAGSGIFISFGGEHAASFGGETDFLGQSSAATGTFTNRCGEVFGASGGFTQFFENSTAADAFFTNEGGVESGNNRGFGFMNFFDNSTAGRGTFVTNGGTVSGALGGDLFFQDNSSAGEGTFTTNGGLMVGAGGGNIGFDNNATAANGTFTTNGGMGIGAPGAEMSFFGSSTAGNGNFTINGGAVGAASGGRTNFFSDSTAATGTFVLNGGAAPGASGGFVKFWDDSTAGDAVFVVNGGTVPKIITPAGTGNGGMIQFINNSTSGNGIFINNGGAVSGASGGLITFLSNGSLGNSTFINNGGEVSGAEGAWFQYFGQHGGTATLIANTGADGASGGSIFFFEEADAPGARIQVFGNGSLDISPHNLSGTRIGSLEGSGLVFLGANNLSVGGNNLDTLFSGAIQDGGLRGGTSGSLTKIGSGTLVLSGSNSYSGDTTIDSGALIVNGSVASPNSFVSIAGLLGGTGFIGGNVFSSGIVSPGDAGPGRLTLNGNYTPNNGATLRIEIGGLALVQHDLLQMNGAAQLEGTLQILRLNNFQFLPGDKVTFLTAASGVSGTFSTVTNPFNDTIVLTRVVYEANQVSLEAVQGSFASLSGLTPNQRAVANNLDVVATGSPGDELIAFLNTELLAALPRDFDLIAPEELASIYETGFSQARMQSLNLQRRMEQIRSGSTGFSASGFNLRGNGRDSGDGKTLANTSAEKPAAIFDPSPENRWGVFVTGAGEYVSIGNDLNARGYDITTGGVTLGLDFRPAPNFALGVSAGYAHSSADLVNNGRVTVEGGKIGVYATYFAGGLYLDSAVGAGWNTFETRRRALLGDTSGKTEGAQFEAMIGTGYDWKKGNWSFGPTTTLQYSDVRINSFQEGRSLGSLQIQEQNENAFHSTLGFKVSYDWKTSRVIVRPDLRVGWQHEFGEQSYPIAARFASGAGDVFTVRGPARDRDRAVVAAGMTVQWSSRVSTYVYYQGQLGGNYDAHGAGGGLSLSF